VVAALSRWHDQHDAAAEALDGVSALPAHVLLETYAVLTRLPGGLAVPATVAADVLLERFPGKPLRLADEDRAALPAALARGGVAGGASYDGVGALEAAAHAQTMLTLDQRAQDAYRRLGTAFAVIGD
jgi:toxin FitB